MSAEGPGEDRSSAPARANRFGLLQALIGFAAGLILASVFGGVASAATGYTGAAHQALPVGVTAADVVGLWIGLTGAAAWASRRHGRSDLGADYGLVPPRRWDLPLGAAAGLACQYGLVPLLYLPFTASDPHLAHRLSQPAQQDTAGAHGVVAAVVLTALLAVGAPVVEELFFRGLVLRALLARAGAPVAVVISALAFALAHFEALQFAGLAAFGVVLGILAWRTGRLAPGMAAHAAFNAAAVASLLSHH